MKVLITGVSSGIGKATCEALIQKNIHVLGVSRNASQISFNSSLYTPYDLNLAKCSQIQKPLEQIQKEHPDIDILICNAGKGLFGSLEEYSYHAMQELMNLNFLSHAILSKVFIPNMKKKKKGKIVFIASEAALQGRQRGSLYCASKAALRSFAQALREECASSGISINIINPGMVRTEFFNELNIAPGPSEENAITPEQVATAIIYTIEQGPNMLIEEINLAPLKKVVEHKKSKQ